MATVRITQVKSTIDRPKVQKLTIQALGLGKINKSVTKELNAPIKGMINRVKHLIVVEEI